MTLLFVAVTSKIVGGFIAARITKFSNHESLAIGCLMNGRGMVEMAIASIGYSMGLIDESLFSIVIAIGFITTIITPVITKPLIFRTVSKHIPHQKIILEKNVKSKPPTDVSNMHSSLESEIILEHRLREIEQEKIILNYLRGS